MEVLLLDQADLLLLLAEEADGHHNVDGVVDATLEVLNFLLALVDLEHLKVCLQALDEDLRELLVGGFADLADELLDLVAESLEAPELLDLDLLGLAALCEQIIRGFGERRLGLVGGLQDREFHMSRLHSIHII